MLCSLQMVKEFGQHTFTLGCLCVAVAGCFAVIHTHTFIPLASVQIWLPDENKYVFM